MSFKVIKSGTNRKLVDDFLLVVYNNFCRITHLLWEIFDVKQSNDLEILPRSSTVVSRESCRVAMYVKCSEYSGRKKRKSPFSTTTLSFEINSNLFEINLFKFYSYSPANPLEYLHKPYILCVPWATFLPLKVYAYFSNRFCLKARIRQTIRCRTDFSAKYPFKDIQDHIFRCHWKPPNRLYITSIIVVALHVTMADIVSERSETRHFRPPHSHLTSLLQRTPANIRIKRRHILLETRIPGLHFCSWWYGSIFIQMLVVGFEKNTCVMQQSA